MLYDHRHAESSIVVWKFVNPYEEVVMIKISKRSHRNTISIMVLKTLICR